MTMVKASLWAFIRELRKELFGGYQPHRHYMRGGR